MTRIQLRCRSSLPWPVRAGGWPCFRRIGMHSRRATPERGPSLSCTIPMPGSTRRSSDRVRPWRSGSSMVLVRKLRDRLATQARALPVARHAWARYRRRRYEERIERFLSERTGRADRLPIGAVYEATMRCNLHCEFCYVGDLLNIEGEWQQELDLDALSRAFPTHDGFQVSLTGGEIFMRKDIMSVLDLFRDKGYACGYLTTNGTIISDERAEALADLAAQGFLKHISVSVDGPKDLHDVARGLKGTFERTTAGLRRLQEAARRKGAPLRVSINTTVAHGHALTQKCRDRNVLLDFRPKVVTALMASYYTPGTKLDGRCLYPFLHARVSFSGKVYFCPFIRVEVGDLTHSSLEEIWNGE